MSKEKLEKGTLVGFDTHTNRWGVRVGVVVGNEVAGVVVADYSGVRLRPIEELNMTMPGFVEMPLPPALVKEYGLEDDKQ